MILDQLVLYNFGVYRGHQAMDLAPPSSERPIILVGGLNGTGKTTLLDAVQLALFGKLAPCVSRAPGSYENFLRASIHRGTPCQDGAAVELAFRQQHEGVEHHLRIRRRWHHTANSLREKLHVERNGHPDPALSGRWLESVDQFVPLGIARLLFFDGEKLAALADPATSADALASGINSLLGLDALDRLVTDLAVYERRQRSKVPNDLDRAPVLATEERLRQLADDRGRLVLNRGTCQNALDRATKALTDCETRFQLHGGDLYDNRAELESRRQLLSQRLSDARDHLVATSAGHAPLLLVIHLLRDAQRQASAESAAAEADRLTRLLATRDHDVVERLRAAPLDPDTLACVQTILADDRRARTRPPVDTPLALPDSVTHELGRLLRDALPDTNRSLSDALRRTDDLQDQLDAVERDLATVPDDDAFAPILAARSTAQRNVDAATRALRAADDSLRQVVHAQDQERRRYEVLLSRAATHALDQEDLHRTLAHSAAVRATLQQFRDLLLTRHARRIASFVLDGFRHLLRKQRLISDLEIDPSSFTLTLRKPDGGHLPPARLSAGERQLLAVSLLWGLARAAGRPLPTIIDTPLGRLDSTHRAHVVERYFPTASHQVLVLSTDEEITPAYWKKLRPHVGRTYTLIHDDQLGSTRIEKSYFGD